MRARKRKAFYVNILKNCYDNSNTPRKLLSYEASVIDKKKGKTYNTKKKGIPDCPNFL
jgi:hypothetical protein